MTRAPATLADEILFWKGDARRGISAGIRVGDFLNWHGNRLIAAEIQKMLAERHDRHLRERSSMLEDAMNLVDLIPDAIVMELGRIVSSWSLLEQIFDMIYMHRVIRDHEFEPDDPRLRELAKPFKVRIKEVRAVVCEVGDAEMHARWDRALSQLDRLRNKRDIVAHGVFHGIPTGESMEMEPNKVHLSYKSYRNQRPHDWGPISLASLQQTRAQIGRLWMELIAIQ